MKFYAILPFLLFTAASSTGCASLIRGAGVESRPGDYHVNGYTDDPEAAIAVSSHAYVEQYNAETYRRAVESGRAYAYPGGGYGNDYWFHYRRVAPAPPRAPARRSSATATGTTGVSREELDAVRGETEEARERADEALRLHRLRSRSGTADPAPVEEGAH